jgi:hypothetical protein
MNCGDTRAKPEQTISIFGEGRTLEELGAVEENGPAPTAWNPRAPSA